MIRFVLLFPLLILLLLTNGSAQIDTLEYSLSGDLPEAVVRGERTYTSEVIRLGRKHVLALPGSFDDPSRLLQSYPSMHTSNDQANSVIYRGQPSLFTTWSLNGSEIVNPNHLGNAGTRLDIGSGSSGGVNLFSGQILKAMEFRSLPYKENHSGLGANMNMIIDNKGQSQYTFGQLSLLGAEAGFNRSKGFWNFVGNARYSTTGLLADMGVTFDGEEIRFQDFVFSLSKESRASQFGLTLAFGRSSNFKPYIDDIENIQTSKDASTINYESTIAIINMLYEKRFGNGYSFQISNAFSLRHEDRDASSVVLEASPLNIDNSASSNHVKYSSNLKLTSSSGLSFLTNLIWNPTNLYATFKDQVITAPPIEDASIDYSRQLEDSFVWRSGLSYKKVFNRSEIFAQGFIPLYKATTIRFATNFNGYFKTNIYKNKVDLKIEGGQKNQLLPSISIGNYIQGNGVNVEASKSNFAKLITLESTLSYKSNYLVHITGFFNSISHLPYSTNTSFFYSEPVHIKPIEGWLYDGQRRSFGIESSIENSFSDGIFYNINGSIFQSKIRRGNEADWQDSFYNTSYSFNATLSYEKSFSMSKAIRLSIAWKQNGGFKELTIDPSKSNSIVTNTISNNTYTHLKPYSRIDFRINYTTKKSYWSLDIQNVLNTANEAFQFYDPLLESVETQNHLGLIPVLTYRRYFGKRIDG